MQYEATEEEIITEEERIFLQKALRCNIVSDEALDYAIRILHAAAQSMNRYEAIGQELIRIDRQILTEMAKDYPAMSDITKPDAIKLYYKIRKQSPKADN